MMLLLKETGKNPERLIQGYSSGKRRKSLFGWYVFTDK
jgi:hypothetical protein